MTEEPISLDVPRWVWPLVVIALFCTAWAALFIFLGPVPTVPVVAAGAIALPLWLGTTYHQHRARRVLPLYIGLVAIFVLQGFEQWLLGYADSVAAMLPHQFAAPVIWSDKVHLGVFTLAMTTLFLFGGAGVFFHHPLGNYVAWLLACLAVFGNVFLLGLQLFTKGAGYLPGMGMGAIALILGLRLGARLIRARNFIREAF